MYIIIVVLYRHFKFKYKLKQITSKDIHHIFPENKMFLND